MIEFDLSKITTDQQLFDLVIYRLIVTNKLSRSFNGPEGLCQYRSEGGLKCAIGHLIPDELYTPSIEGSAVGKPDVLYLVLSTLSGWTPGMIDRARFLRDLQCLHDNMTTGDLVALIVRARDIADDYYGLRVNTSLYVRNDSDPYLHAPEEEQDAGGPA